jgi:hypothetical protein
MYPPTKPKRQIMFGEYLWRLSASWKWSQVRIRNVY